MQAQQFDGSGHPVIAVKGAKVSDYGGKLVLGFLIMYIDVQAIKLVVQISHTFVEVGGGGHVQ